MANMATPFFRDGRQYPTKAQFDAAIDEYERHARRLGDNPNAIADACGWTRGTGAVIRRMSLERRAGA